ncbi:ribosome biogenesis/translation initiation ATPase RLI [Candidatus Woesearchaeota archaeon]|nr:ribosome biogenesis/translation initiation ATPase RLI [Candidatus Woesearchaeota archaeon]
MTRIAVLRKDKCNPGRSDYTCIKVCPVNRMGQECIVKGEDSKPIIDETLCNGCGICPKKCPTGAISIINLPQELDKTPIHRYGRNGFHLYNLPIPQFSKVIGLVGRNGIGKSTAVQILAGVLKPNLGSEQEQDFSAVLDYFKGSEAQGYFEKVRDGQIVISYKPQHVDLISEQFSGTVKELLQHVDERKELEKISNVLELEKILDSDIKNISGGELQRVAIAATVLKKANVYFFDEPTSYLDIKQRLKISKFIRSLADENTAIMVVEHDLIILDYLADNIHLLYGKEDAFGIVSQPKSTRVGLNLYLEGFLKEENVRFRDKAIKFEPRAKSTKIETEVISSWQDIKKTLGNFKLQASSGEIKKGYTIGVLGENGIGKTSFVKLLAKTENPDGGVVSEQVSVAYKAQYLKKSDELVVNVLQNAIAKYENKLITPLGLKELFEKKLDELSGGQLQRVAIAHCLSQDADLYLLDEPSAYLDVEQRLLVSKLIRDLMELNGTSALIVDHDLLFIDYLSEELLVFEGTPAVNGIVTGPYSLDDGMNKFLQGLDITFRRDEESFRPRANKPQSQKDREQKASGKLYYS